MSDELGPWQSVGEALDRLFKRIPKEPLGAISMMLIFVIALRFAPSFDPGEKEIYTRLMFVGIAGSMAIALWKLARTNQEP